MAAETKRPRTTGDHLDSALKLFDRAAVLNREALRELRAALEDPELSAFGRGVLEGWIRHVEPILGGKK